MLSDTASHPWHKSYGAEMLLCTTRMCCSSSDTSSFKARRSRAGTGHALNPKPYTINPNSVGAEVRWGGRQVVQLYRDMDASFEAYSRASSATKTGGATPIGPADQARPLLPPCQ